MVSMESGATMTQSRRAKMEADHLQSLLSLYRNKAFWQENVVYLEAYIPQS